MDNIEQGQGTLGQIAKNPALYNNANATITDVRKSVDGLNKILADLNAGKGTAGKLLKSDELADQIENDHRPPRYFARQINNGKGTIGQLMIIRRSMNRSMEPRGSCTGY